MPARNNPFKPTKPSSGSNFAGRISEISRIRTVLDETKNGNPTNLLVVGERGIGKTSLLLVSKDLATGEINLSEDPFDFLTIFITLDKHTSISELALKIKTKMERALRNSNKAIAFIKDTLRFVQRIEIMGTKIAGESRHTSDVELFESVTDCKLSHFPSASKRP